MIRPELVHLELHTPDSEAAAAFYRLVLGWRSTTLRPRHPYLSVDAGLSAGIVGCGTEAPMWIPYVEVDDVDACTSAAVDLGAVRTLAPRSGPTGRRSVVRSPVAGDVAFWKPS